jgi:hypothetical protein
MIGASMPADGLVSVLAGGKITATDIPSSPHCGRRIECRRNNAGKTSAGLKGHKQMRKKALALVAGSPADIHPEHFPAFRALLDYAAQGPGLDYANYGEPTSYRAEQRNILRDWERVCNLAREAIRLGVTDAEVIECAKHAFSGRLVWNGKDWDYCTGQYWPTEYRKAVAAVLDRAVHDRKRAQRFEPLPDREYSIAEMREIAEQRGSYFFSNARRGERMKKLSGNRIRVTTPGAYSNGGAHEAVFQFNLADGSFNVER